MAEKCIGHHDCDLPPIYPGGVCQNHYGARVERKFTTVSTPNGKVSVGMCPVCNKPSTYSPSEDRFYHTDGSDNDPCWRALLRDVEVPLWRKDKPAVCPVCSKPAVLSREADLYFHLDGSDNQQCHYATLTGRVELPAEVNRFDDLYIGRKELANLPRGEPLIDGVLDRNSVFVVAGRDQTFKSFLVLDWLCCLATGKAWMGREVERVPVLYVVGEGAWGLDARINAWEAAWQQEVESAWFVVRRAPVNLFKQAAAFADLIARIEIDGYGVVVFDTLQRMAAGADQNSARDAGTIIEALDRVRQATNGAVGAVAHTDKKDNDTRGSSAFEDDADIVWRTKRDEDEQTIHLTLAKRKDGPAGTSIDLRPKLIEGTGSLILSSAKSYTPHPDRPPAQAYPILRLLDGEAIPDQGLGATAIMQALKVSSRDQIYRALNWLISEAYVQKVKVGQWPTFKIEPRGTVLLTEIAPDQH